MEITLDVKPRTEKGKGPSRRYRAAGLIPAVFYGVSVEPASLLVDSKQLTQALHTEAGGNVLINLEVDGQSRLTVPREVQRHPIRGTILHVDFVHVARDQKISAQVPVHLIGEAVGVKEGGTLEQHIHELHVEAFPSDIPSVLEVDVSNLAIGDGLKVEDVAVPKGVELLSHGDEGLVMVTEGKLREPIEDEEGAEAPELTDSEAATDSDSPEAGGTEES